MWRIGFYSFEEKGAITISEKAFKTKKAAVAWINDMKAVNSTVGLSLWKGNHNAKLVAKFY